MIERIRFVTVFVRDQDLALNFYVHTLGLEKRDDSVYGAGLRWIEVAPAGSTTSLVLVAPQARLMGTARARLIEGRIGTLSGIVLETSDIQADYERLRDRGVVFRMPPTPRRWGGCEASFTDPDGNELLLVQP